MTTHPFDPPETKPPKKGCGCLVNTLIGLFALLIASIVGIWLVIMHTSLPLRYVASLIEKGGAGSNLKLSGMSGSLSSGLNFKKVEWNNGEITDVRFRYSGLMDVIRRGELIIYEMHIGSATLDSSTFSQSPDSPDTEATDPSATQSEPIEFRLFQIDRISLNRISIHNPTTGNTVTIPNIEWTGFKKENGILEMGDLAADSDHLVIKTTTPKASDYQKHIAISLLPKLDARILKPIQIDAYLGKKDGKPIFDIKAFDESVHFTQAAVGTQQLRASGVNLTDFLDAPLPNQLVLDASAEAAPLFARSGSFLLGTKSFEIQPTPATAPGDKPAGTALLALHRDGDTEIRYEIPVTETKEQSQFLNPALTSTPAMPAADLMALLFHNQEFSTLPPSQQEILRKHMTWFTFSE